MQSIKNTCECQIGCFHVKYLTTWIYICIVYDNSDLGVQRQYRCNILKILSGLIITGGSLYFLHLKHMTLLFGA